MPKIKEVTVGIQRVINLGNYENVRYECSSVVQVDEDGDADRAYTEGLKFCKDNVGAEVDRLMAAKKGK